jgi:outer membrane putative beta-barrel porin/alpha-amylase
MKRLLLILTVLIPGTLLAQDKGPSPMANQADTAISTNDVASLAGFGGSVQPSPNASAGSSAQTGKSAQSGKREKPPRPPVEGSMVGYIDNPIVESQIRIRFDAAFDDQFPDRAEFFYGKCGCYRGAGLDPGAPGPPPGSAVIIPKDLNFQQLYIDGEFAPMRRLSLFAEIPFRWIQAQGLVTPAADGPFPNEGGLSDVMAGFKFAAIASESTYLTFQVRGYFPSGDASKGLGTNHYSVEPEALLYHRFSDRLTLEGQVGDWHPINGSRGVSPAGTPGSEGFAGDVFIYGIGPSYKVYSGNHLTFSPVLELVGWTVLGGFQTEIGAQPSGFAAETSGKNIVNIKIGGRTNIGLHNSFYIGYGHAVTSANWYDQIVRAEYRYSF